VWGPLSGDLGLKPLDGAVPNGSIVAFRLDERDGKPALLPAWVSHDMPSPLPPVVANGVVFALSAGGPSRHATLYALDAGTGKELFSSGNSVTAPAVLTGLAAANGRAYFGTTDGTFYAFGLYMEH
jgi:outer membrane protein assembly factor BamB